MNSHQPFPEDEPVSVAAIILSIVVHGGLLAALFFGVQWKSEQPGGTPVAVYFGSPAASAPPPPPAKVETPEPPKVESKPTPKPEVRAEEKPQIDPQIAIKDKERKEKEEKARLEKERIEQEKADKLKKQKEEEQKQKEKEEKDKKEQARKDEEERKKREKQLADEQRAENTRKEAEREAKQLQKNRDNAARNEQMARMQAELEGAQGSPNGSAHGTSSGARSGGAGGAGGDKNGMDAYLAAIRLKIRGNAIRPSGIQGNPEVQFKITQLPSGEVLEVKLVKSSGNTTLDEAIERAIFKSSPLPLPKNSKLFDRDISLKYKPFEE